jgi:hypothetical protein
MTTTETTTIEECNVRLKVLEISKEILHNSYVDKKAHRHNQWTVQSEIALKKQGTRLPYPTFEPYFSQEEVICVAVKLLAFVMGDDAITEESTLQLTQMIKSTEPWVEEHVIHTSKPQIAASPVEVQDQPPDVGTIKPPQEEIATTPTKATPPDPQRKGLKVFSNWRRPTSYTSD